MIRIMMALAAAASTMGSLAAVDAATILHPRTITTTKDGQPIILARVAVTATPLPN